jgi:histone deacetylase complex regulatory component SIN3
MIINEIEKLLSKHEQLVNEFNTFLPPDFQIIVSTASLPPCLASHVSVRGWDRPG